MGARGQEGRDRRAPPGAAALSTRRSVGCRGGPHAMPNAAPNLILFVLLFGALYFLLIRPQRRRFEAQRQMQASLQLGDEITASGGLVGTSRRLAPDVLPVALSPGVE